jgi:hypothetical protein
MSKTVVLVLFPLLALSSLVMVGSVFAQSIPKPSVPEFTLKFANASYILTTTNPYTGLDETEKVSNNSIEITISNQPFNYPDYQIFYNVRVKPHFGDNWTEVYPVRTRTSSHVGDSIFSYAEYVNEHSIPQSKSSYTNIVFSVIPTTFYSESGYDVKAHYRFLDAIPEDSQLDFQVEALVGHDSQAWVIEHPLYPEIGGYFEQAVAYDETSGWSNTQTVTIGVTQAPTPSPEITAYLEPILILSIIAIVAVFAFGLVLLYRIKRK